MMVARLCRFRRQNFNGRYAAIDIGRAGLQQTVCLQFSPKDLCSAELRTILPPISSAAGLEHIHRYDERYDERR